MSRVDLSILGQRNLSYEDRIRNGVVPPFPTNARKVDSIRVVKKGDAKTKNGASAKSLSTDGAQSMGFRLSQPNPEPRHDEVAYLSPENERIPPYAASAPVTNDPIVPSSNLLLSITSYWSSPELNKFKDLVAYFGKDYIAIANFLQTKTALMVQNQFYREVNGKPELEQLAEQAAQRKSRGENLGTPPSPIQRPKLLVEYDHDEVPARDYSTTIENEQILPDLDWSALPAKALLQDLSSKSDHRARPSQNSIQLSSATVQVQSKPGKNQLSERSSVLQILSQDSKRKTNAISSTISEDRTGNHNTLMTKRLAILGTRTRQHCTSNISTLARENTSDQRTTSSEWIPLQHKAASGSIFISDDEDASDAHDSDTEPLPKRGLSAYMFYANVYREKIRQMYPEVRYGQIGKKLGEQWKAFGADERRPYEILAAKDKERYERQMAGHAARLALLRQHDDFRRLDTANFPPDPKPRTLYRVPPFESSNPEIRGPQHHTPLNTQHTGPPTSPETWTTLPGETRTT